MPHVMELPLVLLLVCYNATCNGMASRKYCYSSAIMPHVMELPLVVSIVTRLL